MNTPWWNHLPLNELSPSQWESLCDGCGKCCLHKLEDEDDGMVYTTAIACELLDCATAQCQDYPHRQAHVPDCMVLRPQDVDAYTWLPHSCAYRLRAQHLPLPDWHPLVTGDKLSTRTQGHSVAGRCISARQVPPDDYQDNVIEWY
jgi:uncharacterized cysteine cluster protein YcgN (CxxCxxCC family)